VTDTIVQWLGVHDFRLMMTRAAGIEALKHNDRSPHEAASLVMIYELRVYRPVPGRLPKLIERFANQTLKIWDRLGIKQVGFWTTMIGEAEGGELTYLLAWDSLADREAKWAALQSDPEWVQVKTSTEADGPINATITNQILVPTSFSKLS